MKKITLLILFLCFTFIVNSQETFESFYTKFYQDTIFQKTRIHTSIEGGISINYGYDSLKYSTWKIVLECPKTNYKKWGHDTYACVKEDASNYTETIYLDGSGYGSVYKYKKILDKWYLVYYLYGNN